jgi:hypothetical protein
MNRAAILILVLAVALLSVLVFHRARPRTLSDLDPDAVRRQPEAALRHVDSLIGQARSGADAAEQARETLALIIRDGTDPALTQAARHRLLELERVLGHNEEASHVLLDTIQAHPGSEQIPQLLFDLGLLLAGPLELPEESIEIFERIPSLYPDHPLAPESVIRVALIRGSADTPDKEGSVSDLREFAGANPDHPLADEALLLVSQLTAPRETDHEE